MQQVLSFPHVEYLAEANRTGEFVTKRLCFSCLFSLAFFALLSGFLLGRFVTYRHLEIKANACKAEVAHRSKSHINAAEYLEKRIHRDHIKEFYNAITDGPKEAGSASSNFQQAVKLQKHFKESGFTSISSLTPSKVLLTYHDPENPTMVDLQNDMGHVKYRITLNATRRFNLPNKAHVTILKRTIQAPPIFVNFGSKQDYDFLESRNISVKNHIFLMKMKKSAIFKQISEAIRKGALGVLLYSDPTQHSDLQKQTEAIKKLTPTILGRLQLAFGDPFCDENNNTTRDSQKSIMVNEIDSQEMQNIFRVMSLNASSKSWTSFMRSSSSVNDKKWRITMSSAVLNLMHTYYNVIASLKGKEEPDRYVLIGSNRESLSNSDNPLGGTVGMMEIARVFGELRRLKDWTPRRTVVFCSWGLQGDGHFNSESWAQLLHPLLTERAVAYLSVELAVKGNVTLKIHSAPILETVIEEASVLVTNPDPEEQTAHRLTLGDTLHHVAKTRGSLIDIVHGEGDYQMFLFEQGIPSLDFGYDGDKEFKDTTFSFHRAITEMWAILIWNLADNPVLPLNPEGYSKFLLKSFFGVQKMYTTLIEKHLTLFNKLHNAIVSFNSTASDFQKKVHNIDKTDCLGMRVVNDQLVRLEKQMLCFPEMQNQGAHPLLTEGSIQSVGFGVLQDLLEESLMWPESGTVQRQIQQELSMLSTCIQNGELLLKDVVKTLVQIEA